MAIKRISLNQNYDEAKYNESVGSTILGIDWKWLKKVLLWGAVIVAPLGLLYWLFKYKFRNWLGAIAGLPLGLGNTIRGYGESALDVIKYSLQAGRLVKPEEVKAIQEGLAKDEKDFKEEAQQKAEIAAMYKAGGAVAEKPDLKAMWSKDVQLLPAETSNAPGNKILVSVPYNGDVYTLTLNRQACEDIFGTTTDNRKIGGSLMTMIYNRYMHFFPKLSNQDIAKRIKGWEFLFSAGSGDYWAPRINNYWEAFKTNTPAKTSDKEYDFFEIEE